MPSLSRSRKRTSLCSVKWPCLPTVWRVARWAYSISNLASDYFVAMKNKWLSPCRCLLLVPLPVSMSLERDVPWQYSSSVVSITACDVWIYCCWEMATKRCPSRGDDCVTLGVILWHPELCESWVWDMQSKLHNLGTLYKVTMRQGSGWPNYPNLVIWFAHD